MSNNTRYSIKIILRRLLPLLLFAIMFFLWSPHVDAKIEVEGDREFRDAVNECLNTYGDAQGVVRDTILELENSEHTHKIVKGDSLSNTVNDADPAFDGTGVGTVTEVSPERLEELKKVIETLKHKDFCALLFHELWHAVDADRGEWGDDKFHDIHEDEVEAVIFQNFIHALRGVPPRTVYGGQDLSNRLILTDSERGGEEIVVLVLGGENYPIEQFIAAMPDACDADHYHSASGGSVYSLEGSAITDPAPGECGFGKVSEVEHEEMWVSGTVLDQYRERTQ